MTKKSKRQAAERQSVRAEREAGFDAAITQFDADIEEAEKIADPVERILKLDEMRQNIAEIDCEILGALGREQEAIKVSHNATEPFEQIAEIRRNFLKKKLAAEVKDHLQKMNDQRDSLEGQRRRVGELVNTAAENNVIEISKSQSCEQVLEVPGVTPIFAKAAARQIVVYEARLAEASASNNNRLRRLQL